MVVCKWAGRETATGVWTWWAGALQNPNGALFTRPPPHRLQAAAASSGQAVAAANPTLQSGAAPPPSSSGCFPPSLGCRFLPAPARNRIQESPTWTRHQVSSPPSDRG